MFHYSFFCSLAYFICFRLLLKWGANKGHRLGQLVSLMSTWLYFSCALMVWGICIVLHFWISFLTRFRLEYCTSFVVVSGIHAECCYRTHFFFRESRGRFRDSTQYNILAVAAQIGWLLDVWCWSEAWGLIPRPSQSGTFFCFFGHLNCVVLKKKQAWLVGLFNNKSRRVDFAGWGPADWALVDNDYALHSSNENK